MAVVEKCNCNDFKEKNNNKKNEKAQQKEKQTVFFLGLVNSNISVKHVTGHYFSASKRDLVQSPSCENFE